ncbi:GAF domain-containing protein [Arcanobacterium hippocoleae]|uniref:Signal transduction histidine kinase n=1 Tax=Arcanobacterium hippocoleae TaxID=149017 RepID=A0ABU1T411_9ACTO|nr:GAF domain-containing protein [Arcanobacterium hippocoleae]MDR6940131.1 signal transduction histidine kinase [Arcanobacterium hippocoleae]
MKNHRTTGKCPFHAVQAQIARAANRQARKSDQETSTTTLNTFSASTDATLIREVLSKALDLTTTLDRDTALQYFVDSACELTGAKYAAIAVIDAHGDTIEFQYSGLSKEIGARIGSPPEGHGVFADIPERGALIVNDLLSYPNSDGFPSPHPVMHNFLGVILPAANDEVWGRLYLANKLGGFTQADAETMSLLASGARIAIQNAKQYAQSQSRARWLTASQNIVSSLLEGSDEEEALQVITDEMRTAARADVALMVLPSINDTWVAEIGSGDGAMALLGTDFPSAGRAQSVIREQSGIVVESMQRLSTVRVESLRQFGPALYAPLVSQGIGRGVIILFRRPKAPEFDLHDLSMAENVSQQAAIALELAEARHAKELAAELDERARISRDLHDLAIQQLFASGMHITAVKEDLGNHLDAKIVKALDSAIWAIDESVGQIRKIVQSLRDDSNPAAVVERLGNETSVALQALGFAPSLIISWNGEEISSEFDRTIIDDAIGSDISDDVVAVVRECLSNVARHAHASSVTIQICASLEQIEIYVTDDGTGIAPSPSRRSGLANLSARARRHHGTFRIAPRNDGMSGTAVHWQVPLR